MAVGPQDTFTLGVIFVNIILTLVLLTIYGRNYKALKSKMVLGLLFFSIAFLLENIMDLFFYNTLLSQAMFDFTLVHLSVNILEMIGLLILLYVTWK